MSHPTTSPKTLQEKINLLSLTSPYYLADYIQDMRTRTSLLSTYQNALFLRSFIDRLSCDGKPIDASVLAAVSHEQIQKFASVNQTTGKACSITTYKVRISILNSFFNYLNRKNYLRGNPTIGIHPKQPVKKNTATPLLSDDIRTVLYHLYQGDQLSTRELKSYEKTKFRDIAIVTLLVNTGMTLDELCHLTLQDISFPYPSHLEYAKDVLSDYPEDKPMHLLQNYLSNPKQTGANPLFINGSLIVGESSKLRTIFINGVTSAALTFYLILERPDLPASEVFLSLKNGPLARRSVEYMIGKYFERYTDKHVTTNDLRFYHAKKFMEINKDINACAKRLGYKDTLYLQKILMQTKFDSYSLEKQMADVEFF